MIFSICKYCKKQTAYYITIDRHYSMKPTTTHLTTTCCNETVYHELAANMKSLELKSITINETYNAKRYKEMKNKETNK